MLLSLVLHTYSLRYLLPTAIMMGSAPTYFLAWGVWRVLSCLLPTRVYHQVDDRLYTLYQSMVLFFFENYTGVEVVIYGDLPKQKENVVYLSNHQSTVDWIIADMLAIRQDALGHVRYVLKDGLKFLPLYGWYFSQHGGIYVKRSANFNEDAMRSKLQAQVETNTPTLLFECPRFGEVAVGQGVLHNLLRKLPQSSTQLQMYLVIFPEGTRYNPELPKVIADSQTFADREGLAVLKHVLTPRVKATHVAINAAQDHLAAVYDVTVAYEGTVDTKGNRKEAPSMTEFLCKECPRVHIYVERVDRKEIPEELPFMRRWLHERFEIKDNYSKDLSGAGLPFHRLLAEFYESENPERRNRFPMKCLHSKLSLKKTFPSLLFLGGLTAGMLLTESGRKLYVKTWIYGTLIGCLWVSVKS